MATTYAVVLVTVPNKEVARSVAHHLVENRLAACANIISTVESIYSWEGKIQQDEEVLLLIKTRMELVEGSLIPAVKSIHPYEVPEIIALPVTAGSQSYLNWISEVTR